MNHGPGRLGSCRGLLPGPVVGGRRCDRLVRQALRGSRARTGDDALGPGTSASTAGGVGAACTANRNGAVRGCRRVRPGCRRRVRRRPGFRHGRLRRLADSGRPGPPASPDAPSHTCARTCSTPPAAWRHAFDLVVEIITLQALPPDLHAQAGSAVRDFVAPDGTLLVIGAVPDDAVATGPWPLTRAEIEALATGGLQAISIEIRETPDAPIDLRWRAEFRRAGPGTCA